MLANVAHSPAWRSQGYVCLACRINRRQRRRFQTEAATSADSWFEGLNDINNDFGSGGKTQEKKEEAMPKKELKAKEKENEKEKERSKTVTGDDLLFALGRPSGETKSNGKLYTPKGINIIKQYGSGTIVRPVAAGLEDTSFHKDRRKGVDRAIAEESAQAGVVKVEVKQDDGGKVTKKQDMVDAKTRLIALLKKDRARSEKQEGRDGQEDNVMREKRDSSDNSLGFSFGVANNGLANRNVPSDGGLVTGHSTTFPPETQHAPVALPAVQEKAADVSDKPMRLVDRYLQNKKQTLPWGTRAGTDSRVSIREHASSAKIAAKTKINNMSKANERSNVASSNHEPPKLERMQMLRADLFRKTDAEQTVTEADVVDQLENSADRTTMVEEVPTPSTADAVAFVLSSSPAEEVMDQQQELTGTTAPSMQGEEAAVLSSSEPSGSTQEQVEGPDPASVRLARMYESRTATPASAQMRLGGLYEEDGPLQSCIKSERKNGISSRSPPQSRSFHATTSRGSARHANKVADRSALRATKSLGAAMKAPFRTSATRHAVARPAEKSADTASEEEETPSVAEIMSIEPASIKIEPVDIPQPPVPFLEYGLDRVLFNPGVYQLQDPASRVYNFDPYLQKIMPVAEFDFDSLKEYKTSSQDHALAELAKAQNKKYIGSTSSMTSSLAHFHYLLSNWRPLNLSMLTDGFVTKHTKDTLTEINRAPSAIFLRWKDGTYAIDADKEFDGANVLMLLGKSMELLLTLPKSDYERYRKSDPRKIPEAERTAPESYQYTTMRDFLMRSQLDAYDPRLPGRGTFDLKTRAVVTVRMQAQDFEPMTGYEIFGLHGKWGSYEREYFDMMRSTMLKYMLQARMGQMNGIFVAYHNVKRIFGFQYIPMHEMDRALHGQTDSCLGDQEFKASLEIMNELFNKATAKFPGQSLRFHFETQKAQRDEMPTALHVFAEPMSEEDIDRIQNSQKVKIQEFERNIMGKTGAGEAEQSTTSSRKEPAKTIESSTTLSTNSDADTSFLSSISSHKTEENLKPLFYATVIVQSKVNDDTPQDDRPSHLKREDKWEIDYIIKDFDITPHEWALYEDCRARRKYAFTERDDEDGGDAENEGKSKQTNSFIKLLKDMATEGKAFRDKIDVMEAGKENLTVDVPLPKQREKIEDVDDYMSWMYGSK